MKKIMNLLAKDTRHYLLIILLSLISIMSLKNDLNNTIQSMHGDEIHTLVWGTTHSVDNVPALRVGESTRWLVRILSPLGKYYMATKMGGEHHITGWYYAGGYYLDNNFKNTSIENDPNIQDYVFIMRLLLGITVIISFSMVSFVLIKNVGFISGVMYLTLPFTSFLLWESLGVFYTESALILCFNLIIFLFFSIKNITRLYFWSAFFLVFALSTKITGVLFVLPILVMIYKKDRLGLTSSSMSGFIKIEGFTFLCLLMFTLWNISSGSYGRWVDAMVSNVYHFKTGHLITNTENQWQKTLALLFPWIALFPLAIAGIFYSKVKDNVFYLSLSAVFIIMVISLVDVAWLLERNYTTATIICIFIISVGLGETLNIATKHNRKWHAAIVITLLLTYSLFISEKYQPISEETIYSSFDIGGCDNIASIGINFDNGMKVHKVESMPEIFTLQSEQDMFISKVSSYDCLIVNRIGNNKQYSNYLAPMTFKLINRKGDYFLFKDES